MNLRKSLAAATVFAASLTLSHAASAQSVNVEIYGNDNDVQVGVHTVDTEELAEQILDVLERRGGHVPRQVLICQGYFAWRWIQPFETDPWGNCAAPGSPGRAFLVTLPSY